MFGVARRHRIGLIVIRDILKEITRVTRDSKNELLC